MFLEKLGADFELEVISKEDYNKRYEMIFGTADEDEYEDADWASITGIMPGIEIEP